MSIAARILAGLSSARNGEKAPRLESVNNSTSGSTGTKALIGLIAKSTEPPAGSVSAAAPTAPGTGLVTIRKRSQVLDFTGLHPIPFVK